ncbi:ribbon-helix-helix protein, CopG family [Natronococcus sp. JC468]|uniref:ribbon-helix-helix protein, CopG family n=1 Tax=Natronococcus sp. JC468 TaxID=1961921 RepID=UPI001ADF58C9|nr:ribbon-helix-helix protein, CopG family [Natronococcus sp. JC468]
MEPITLRLSSDILEKIDNEAEEQGLSRAESFREIVGNRHEHEEIRSDYEMKLSDYEENLSELKTEVERLRNEKRLILEQRRENMELVEYVEREKSLSERKAQAGDCYAREVVAHRDTQRRRITD